MYENQKQIILSHLYQMRSLSYEEILEFFFRIKGCSKTYADKILQIMKDEKLLQKHKIAKGKYYYTITCGGITFLKKHGLIKLGENIAKPYDDFLKPSDIKLNDNVVQHQLSLNHFVLRFFDEFKDVSAQYFDEKFVSMFKEIRPDGLIATNDTLFFLEMDMGTERKQSLYKKWEGYRSFLTSNFYYNLNEKVEVMFILNQMQRHSVRSRTLQEAIKPYLFDKISNRFDIFLGNEDLLFKHLYMHFSDNVSIPFGLSRFSRTDNYVLDGMNQYTFYSYLFQMDKEFIKKENGTLMEFLYDDHSIDNMGVFAKIVALKRLESVITKKHGRMFKYLILVESEKDAFDLLKLSDGFSPYIYFTTKERLKGNSFYSALFQISREGTVTHFSEFNLRIPIIESRFSSFPRE